MFNVSTAGYTTLPKDNPILAKCAQAWCWWLTRLQSFESSDHPLHWEGEVCTHVFCAMSRKRVYGPFFFEEGTVNSEVYLAMLQDWLIEKLHEEESADFVFQQDGAPAHWSHNNRHHSA